MRSETISSIEDYKEERNLMVAATIAANPKVTRILDILNDENETTLIFAFADMYEKGYDAAIRDFHRRFTEEI